MVSDLTIKEGRYEIKTWKENDSRRPWRGQYRTTGHFFWAAVRDDNLNDKYKTRADVVAAAARFLVNQADNKRLKESSTEIMVFE